MVDEIETKREELRLINDKLDKLEHGRGDVELVKRYRARARRLADQIIVLGTTRDA